MKVHVKINGNFCQYFSFLQGLLHQFKSAFIAVLYQLSGQQHVILSVLLSLKERSLISLNLLLGNLSSSVWEKKKNERNVFSQDKSDLGHYRRKIKTGPIIVTVSSFILREEICLNSWLHQQCRQRRNSHSVSLHTLRERDHTQYTLQWRRTKQPQEVSLIVFS